SSDELRHGLATNRWVHGGFSRRRKQRKRRKRRVLSSAPAATHGEIALDLFHFVIQSSAMESDWAAENLRVIRTLMERSAIYRRALAPMMLLAGGAGTVAATAGWLAGIEAPRAFSGYWLGVAVLTI